MELHKTMNEFEARDYILEKSKKIESIEDLANLIKEVETDFNYGYGVAARSVGAVSAAVAWYLSGKMGLTGFQASFVTWDFITGFWMTHNKCGMRIVDYDHMLYPQYDYKFQKTISPEVWERLQKTAKEYLEDPQYASPSVIKHWQSIVDGQVPFGYVVKEDD